MVIRRLQSRWYRMREILDIAALEGASAWSMDHWCAFAAIMILWPKALLIRPSRISVSFHKR